VTQLRPRHHLLIAALSASALLTASCGGGDDDTSSSSTPSSTASVTAVAGCEDAKPNLAVDAQKKPARCKAGAPAAAPLPTRTKVKVAVSSKSAEFTTPFALGVLKGEFDKENLDIEVQVLPPADALQLLASGGIDVVVGSSTAAVFNAIDQGFAVKWALGQGWNSPDSGAGLWAKGADAKIGDLKGKTVGSAVGIGSPVNLAIAQALPQGMAITDLKYTTQDVTQVGNALQNGAVASAIMLDPYWLPFKGKGDYTFLAPSIPAGGNVGGVYYGPSFTKNQPAATAWARAYIRTVNTYLVGDYKADPATVADVAKALDTPVDKVKATPSFIWDFDVPHGQSDGLQQLFLDAKVATYKQIVPEATVVDRQYVAAAVGIPRA
jgi:NitT/TauT family transport system substrate-binding protein